MLLSSVDTGFTKGCSNWLGSGVSLYCKLRNLWHPRYVNVRVQASGYQNIPSFSLFHMKITTSVAKNSHQDRGPCHLHLPVLFIYILFCGKIKTYCDRCFPQQIRPQTTVQPSILQDYSSVRIDVNVINKRLTLPVAYTILKSVKFK